MPTAPSPPDSSAAPRVGALAVLPVFIRLAGRRAVVAGASEAIAWKAELLAAAGAEVHVHAGRPGPALAALLEAGDGRFVHHRAPWSPPAFAGAAIAVCDAACEEEARAFCAAARTAGVPVNVVDRPAYCDFQFGAIVNRSPAVIAISTDGAAPVLAQAIRRRIEAVLPPALARWAELARGLRGRVNERLVTAPQRRAFWARFAELAFGPPPAGATPGRLLALAATCAAAAAGSVSFVGAGPGDPELVTLKAVRALQAADLIVHDSAVPAAVLELARREAERRPIGTLDDPVAAMAAQARAGRHVVRLMAGDPATCRRAAADIARLRQAGVAMAVVPGIVSAPPAAVAADRRVAQPA